MARKRKAYGNAIGSTKRIDGKTYTLHSKYYHKGKARTKAKGLRRYHTSVRVEALGGQTLKKSGSLTRTVWGVYVY